MIKVCEGGSRPRGRLFGVRRARTNQALFICPLRVERPHARTRPCLSTTMLMWKSGPSSCGGSTPYCRWVHRHAEPRIGLAACPPRACAHAPSCTVRRRRYSSGELMMPLTSRPLPSCRRAVVPSCARAFVPLSACSHQGSRLLDANGAARVRPPDAASAP